MKLSQLQKKRRGKETFQHLLDIDQNWRAELYVLKNVLKAQLENVIFKIYWA